MPLVAQPAFAITHVPYQAGPQVVVVPSPPAVPVPRPGHQAYYHQYQYRPHPAPTPYAVVSPAAVSLGTQICPACAAHVPTLDLTSHLRMHGWRV
ncbi:hypothetical protein EXIGLDRAFT_724597 [Exidia glandulosa HHB12029]|uniref:Uncharacterized protein n=1 Tax=Exidia glandulosa HHB12029 TaxID=1314781 RepID=A0A165MPL3_EXIGL|nr:hypothetical protein EXIGLDRAFT_724597 [Exidia glandulosa HHB12029]